MSEIRRIIARGEGQQLDFKFRVDDKRKIARTLVAFANTDGGKLLIGVKDNGKVKGINPEEEFYMIEGAAHAYCQPEVSFESKVWEEGHHLVLEIDVPKSENRHKAPDEDGKWRHYVRVDDHTLMSNKILERVWRLKKHGQARPREFDELTSSFLSIIREESPLRISKLYKKSGMKMIEVDKLLAQLICWDVVQMDMSEMGTFYSISE